MRYLLYFIIGGTVVSLTTYLGSLGRSWLAAFITTFPALTGLTFILMYLNAGVEPTVPVRAEPALFCRSVADLRRVLPRRD
jgi:hypothetical protein